MTTVSFVKLEEPTSEIAEAIHRWENDPDLVPFIRPSKNREDLAQLRPVTVETLAERVKKLHFYLIYLDGQLIGEMSFKVDPDYLFKNVAGTAWIGITIGEADTRGRGIGYKAIRFLEQQISTEGLKRIELGVFEFNKPARALYRKLGYQEIGRIDAFTYWDGRMWQDIRMEKYLRQHKVES